MKRLDYQCDRCSHIFTVSFLSVHDSTDGVVCIVCGGPTKIIYLEGFQVQTDDYWSGNNPMQKRIQKLVGVPVYDKKKAEALLAASGHGVREAGMDRDAKRNKQYIQEKEDKERSEFVGETVHKLSTGMLPLDKQEIKGVD